MTALTTPITPALSRFQHVLSTYAVRTAVTPDAKIQYALAVHAAAYALASIPGGEDPVVTALNATDDGYLADALRTALREAGSDRVLRAQARALRAPTTTA